MKATTKHVETWRNGGIVVEADNCIPELEYSDLLVVGYSTYYIFTLRGYYQETKDFGEKQCEVWWSKGQTPEPYMLRDASIDIEEKVAESKLRHPNEREHSITGRGAVLCQGEHPDKGKAFLKVELGQQVMVEGVLYEIAPAPNRNLSLNPVKVEVAA